MVDYASQIRLPDYSRLASGVQGLIGLQGNLLQQRALTQQMEANKAASEAAKLSTDPATGQIDQAKFTQLLSQGPGAYNIPEYLGKFQQLSNAQLEAKAKQLDIAQKQLGFFGGQLGSLVNMGERATPQDVIRTLANGVQLGMMTPEQAQQYATQIPADPKELQSWLRQHWIGLQRTQEQIGLLPQGSAIDTGGAQIMTNRDPITGQISTAAVVPKTLTPGEASANVTVIDPNTGAQYQITKEQQLRMQGQSPDTGAVPGGLQTSLGPGQEAELRASNEARGRVAGEAEGKAITGEKARQIITTAGQIDNSIAQMQRMRSTVETLEKMKGLDGIVGLTPERLLTIVPGTPQADALAQFDTLKSQIAQNVLQMYRNMSETGGAVGQVSNHEQQLFQNNLAALDRAQSPKQFRESLGRIKEFVDGSETRLKRVFDAQYGSGTFDRFRRGELSLGGSVEPSPTLKASVSSPTTASEYSKLPPGTVFRAPDGTLRRKP